MRSGRPFQQVISKKWYRAKPECTCSTCRKGSTRLRSSLKCTQLGKNKIPLIVLIYSEFNAKHKRQTSGELLSNNRRAVRFGSSQLGLMDASIMRGVQAMRCKVAKAKWERGSNRQMDEGGQCEYWGRKMGPAIENSEALWLRRHPILLCNVIFLW